MPRPAAPECLSCVYADKPSQKGGTLIREDVLSRDLHRAMLADPDDYRPEECANCGCQTLHAHSLRSRVLGRGEDEAVEWFRRFLCVGCHGVWTVLAGFMARWLHQTWRGVDAALVADGELSEADPVRRLDVPERTRLRWGQRLRASAALIVQVLAEGVPAVRQLAPVLSQTSRAQLVEVLTEAGTLAKPHRLGGLAGWLHRLVPGIRLM